MTTDHETAQARRSALLDKISALLAKTQHNGCSEAEALAAAELAQKLMDKYGLRARHEISVSNISCIWTNCIVPFSVERVGTNIYFFNLFF